MISFHNVLPKILPKMTKLATGSKDLHLKPDLKA